jgi:hypothetical protein
MKINNYREQPQGSKIHAFFDLEVDVKIPELDVTMPWNCRNWKVIQGKNGNLYPVSPSFCEEPTPGQRKWSSYIEPDPKFAKEVLKKIYDLLQPLIKHETTDSATLF